MRALLLGFLLAACVDNDPLYREGLWQPAGVGRANLALEVANPHDLSRGAALRATDGQVAAAAVDRLHADRVKKLPSTALSGITLGGSGDAGGQ